MSLKEKMTAIADAIREKTGQPGTLTLDEMAAAIGTISAGAEVRRVTGSFTTDTSGAAFVSCGFRPDVVVGYVGAYADMEFYYSFVFSR